MTATTPTEAPLAAERFHVPLGDTDAAGIIYYGAPLRWAERLSSAWLRECGMPLGGLFEEGRGTPAVHVEISYRQPLRLDDEVDATLWPHTLRRRSFTLESRFARITGGEPAVVVRVTMVFVEGVRSDRLRAAPLPAVLAEQLLRGAPSPGD